MAQNISIHGHEQLPLVVGVDIGGTQIRASVLSGQYLHSRVSAPTGKDLSQASLLADIEKIVFLAIEESQMAQADIQAIGIAMPGVIDSRKGIVHTSANLPSIIDVHLSDLVCQSLSIPITVANDANVAALGEYTFGAGKDSSHMMYVTISTGIGAGIVTQGSLFEGARGSAGELGHMTINMHGAQCPCGNIGCLELYASGTAIARIAHEAVEQGKAEDLRSYMKTQRIQDPISTRMLGTAAEYGISSVQTIIRQAGEALGMGLVNALNLFNPDRIVLGGGVVQLGQRFLSPAFNWVQKYGVYTMPPVPVCMELAMLGQDAGLIGAGALAYQSLQSTSSKAVA
jgi:glucokinase